MLQSDNAKKCFSYSFINLVSQNCIFHSTVFIFLHSTTKWYCWM